MEIKAYDNQKPYFQEVSTSAVYLKAVLCFCCDNERALDIDGFLDRRKKLLHWEYIDCT